MNTKFSEIFKLSNGTTINISVGSTASSLTERVHLFFQKCKDLLAEWMTKISVGACIYTFLVLGMDVDPNSWPVVAAMVFVGDLFFNHTVPPWAEGGHPGIEGGKNICFLNAIFQVVMHITPWKEAIRTEANFQAGMNEKLGVLRKWMEGENISFPELEEEQEKNLFYYMGTDLFSHFYQQLKKENSPLGKEFYAFLTTCKTEVDSSITLNSFEPNFVFLYLSFLKGNPDLKAVFLQDLQRLVVHLEHLQTIKREIDAYDEASRGHQMLHHLGELRKVLLPERAREGHAQQSSYDVLTVLQKYLPPYRHPQLWFEGEIRRTFVKKQEVNYTDQDRQTIQAMQGRVYDKEDQESFILSEKRPYVDLGLSLEGEGAEEGQALLGRTLEERVEVGTLLKRQDSADRPVLYEQNREQFIPNRLPQVLAVHLKRFNNDRTVNEKSIEMPATLVIQDRQYEKCAIVCHQSFGSSIQSGHYTSYVKKEETWWKNDDAWVTKKEREPSTNKKGYLYFYTHLTQNFSPLG